MTASVDPAEFTYDGRGPELERLIWSTNGVCLLAAEYRNPEMTSTVRHLRFVGTQVTQITPEEVIGAAQLAPSGQRREGVTNLGRSAWLQSFAPLHLEHCAHYRVLFYDELLDVICERVESHAGRYAEPDRDSR